MRYQYRLWCHVLSHLFSAWIVVSNIHVDYILGPSHQTFSQDNFCCIVKSTQVYPVPSYLLRMFRPIILNEIPVLSTSTHVWSHDTPFSLTNPWHNPSPVPFFCILTFHYLLLFFDVVDTGTSLPPRYLICSNLYLFGWLYKQYTRCVATPIHLRQYLIYTSSIIPPPLRAVYPTV